MRIIVGNGKMAQAIAKTSDVVLGHKDIEITDDLCKVTKTLRQAADRLHVRAYDGPVVVNTAAKINLEWCEQNPEKAWTVNTIGALNLAKACDILGFKFVQISSGCIFDGGDTGRVYTEEDTPTPASFYAVTKSAADNLIAQAGIDVPILTLRPRQVVSASPNPTNMLTKFMSLGLTPRFITSANSITGLEDFSSMLDHLLQSNVTGVYNCASHGTISPYEIAVKLKSIHPGFEPQPVEYAEYVKSLKVKRVNTILNVEKLQKSGYATRSANHVIDWCVANYGKLG